MKVGKLRNRVSGVEKVTRTGTGGPRPQQLGQSPHKASSLSWSLLLNIV